MEQRKKERRQQPHDWRAKEWATAIHVAEILSEGGIHARAYKDGTVRVFNAPLSVEVVVAKMLPMAPTMLDRYYKLVGEIPVSGKSPLVVGHSWYNGIRQTVAMLPLHTLVQMIGEKE